MLYLRLKLEITTDIHASLLLLLHIIILWVDISVLINYIHHILGLRHLSKDVDAVITTTPEGADKDLSDFEGNRIFGDSPGNL